MKLQISIDKWYQLYYGCYYGNKATRITEKIWNKQVIINSINKSLTGEEKWKQ